MVFRSGWDRVAVEGSADLAGPDDQLEGVSATDLPRLLREVYAAAVAALKTSGPSWTRPWRASATPLC